MRNAIVFVFSLAMSAVSFAQTLSGSSVGTYEARQAAAAQEGVVIDAMEAVIERAASSEARGTGAAIGGTLGAVIGQSGSRPTWQKSTGLALLGTLAGQAVAAQTTAERLRAQQLMVRLSNGQIVAVVQQVENFILQRGDTVYVITGAQSVRVVPRQVVPASGG